jgi:hypothetical protein
MENPSPEPIQEASPEPSSDSKVIDIAATAHSCLVFVSIGPDSSSFESMMKSYNESLQQGASDDTKVPMNTMELIYQNLLDKSGQHMVIFIEASSVVEEVSVNQTKEFEVSIKRKPSNKLESLCPGAGQDAIATVVKSKLPPLVKEGFTVVVNSLPEVYGCMYDLLSQNFTVKEADGEKLCNLFFDTTKLTVPVSGESKCVILTAREGENTNIQDCEQKQQFSSVSLNFDELRAAASITVKQIESLLGKKEDGKKRDLKSLLAIWQMDSSK